MDRYQRIEKPREETPISENEIRNTTQGRIRNYITYATTLLQEKGSNKISLKPIGRAINKTVMISELIKRRVPGLHQITYIGSTNITDMWEPLEESLLPLKTTRHVSVITVTLSMKELDTSPTGYQEPIPADQVKQWTEYDYERRNFSNGVMEYNAAGGFDGGRGYGGYDAGHGYGGFEGGYGGRGQGRGRARSYRGMVRGRRYGSGGMQPESGGYTVYNDYGGGAPSAQSRGRDCGSGRARSSSRGVGGILDGAFQGAV